jgi:hypothetical protein
MKLFIEGHNVNKGFIISRLFSDSEIEAFAEKNITSGKDVNHGIDSLNDPIRHFACKDKARVFIGRYNRRFSTH